MSVDARILPTMIAPNDNPTFANMFSPKIENCLLSKRFVDSRAKEDIVVKEPQNPTAIRRKILCQDSRQPIILKILLIQNFPIHLLPKY